MQHGRHVINLKLPAAVSIEIPGHKQQSAANKRKEKKQAGNEFRPKRAGKQTGKGGSGQAEKSGKSAQAIAQTAIGGQVIQKISAKRREKRAEHHGGEYESEGIHALELAKTNAKRQQHCYRCKLVSRQQQEEDSEDEKRPYNRTGQPLHRRRIY